MIAVGRYFLDGIDMFTTYGFIPEDGSEQFLQYPERKQPLSYNWKERNGTEYDLVSTPTYEDRSFKLKGWITGINEADFWNKFNALWAVLNTTGYRTLSITDLNKNFQLFYKRNPSLTKKTPIKQSGRVIIAIELEFTEVFVPTIPGIIIYYGFTSSAPTTAAQVKALPYSQSAAINTFTIATGTNRFFAFGIPFAKSVVSAFDQTSQEDVTSEYIITQLVVDGYSYKIGCMQIAVAYSTNHNHFITIV